MIVAVQRDLENWLNRLVPELDPLYTHTQEGPDDMPAHIKGAITATSLSVPLMDGRLALGTWQGIYLWEHRHNPGPRQVVVERLQGHYGETRQSIGMATQGRVVEVFASAKSGTWTITVTLPNGMTCLVASGQAFETLTEAPAPDGTPS